MAFLVLTWCTVGEASEEPIMPVSLRRESGLKLDRLLISLVSHTCIILCMNRTAWHQIFSWLLHCNNYGSLKVPPRWRENSSSSRHFSVREGQKATSYVSRLLVFRGPRRREGEIRHLVNSTSWVQKGEKTRSDISSTQLLGSKKTRRRDPASRQLDFLGPRRWEAEFLDLVKSNSCVQEGEKASF